MLGGVISQRVRFFHHYGCWGRRGRARARRTRRVDHHTTSGGQLALGFVHTHPATVSARLSSRSENILSLKSHTVYFTRGGALKTV